MSEETRRVVVATGNPGKVIEIRAALDLPGWQFVTAEEIGVQPPEVEETGETFVENAVLKADAYMTATGLPALADDSGLEVDILDGRPGVRSSRFSGEGATDDSNNELLLAELSEVAPEERTARFRCVVALVEPDGTVVTAQGACEGAIEAEPRGQGGFGYDPLFAPTATPGRTMAQLELDEKNAISHRGAALAALRSMIERSPEA